jgi:hypothetical protein
MTLTAEELIVGASAHHEITVPHELLATSERPTDASTVVLRPLTVRDLQQIGAASVDNDGLSAALMIQQALVEPELRLDQITHLPAGLARFLVDRINEISGVDSHPDQLTELVQTPLARACFVLAKEFGWTPEEVSGMTIGQILLYLEMSRNDEVPQ